MSENHCSVHSRLYLMVTLVDMAAGAVLLAVPLRAIHMGAGPLLIGGLGFNSTLFYISFCFLFGRLSDKWGRRRIILGSCPVFILSFLVMGFSVCLYQLYLGLALLGIGMAMFWPSVEAWIAESRSKRPLLRRLALFNICWSLGWATGSPVGGFLFQVNLSLPFYFAVAIGIGVFFLSLREPKEIRVVLKASSFQKMSFSGETDESGNDLPLPPSSFYLRLAWLANFTIWFSLAIIRYLFPKFAVGMGIEPWLLGVFMGSMACSQVLTFFVLGKTEVWHYRPFPLLFMQGLGSVSFLLILLTNSLAVFFLAFILFGCSIGMTYSSSLFYSVDTLRGRGSRAGIHETIVGTGGLFGPLAGGIIAQNYSLKSVYLLAFMAILIGISIQIYLLAKRRAVLAASIGSRRL